MLLSLELLKPNHADLEAGKPSLLLATGLWKPAVGASVLEVLPLTCYNHQGTKGVWQIRFFSCVGMINVMKVLIFAQLVFFSRPWCSEIGRDFFVALNCVVNHCGGFKVNAKQSGEVPCVIINKSTLDSLRRASCQSRAQRRAAAWVFPLDSWWPVCPSFLAGNSPSRRIKTK